MLDGLEDSTLPDHLDVGLIGDVRWYEASSGRGDMTTEQMRKSLWYMFKNASLVVANLEAPITGHDTPAAHKQYIYRTSNAVLDIFDQRFVLCLANNHIMDYGVIGLLDTISALDEAGIPYAGAGSTIDQAKTPCLITVEGLTTAVICAADPRFNAASPNRPGTCPAHPEILTEAIRGVQKQSTLIIVSLHLGLEHVRVPSIRQIRLAEICLGNGAHIVQFHHAHRSSGAAFGGHGVVLFGTGNYVFPLRSYPAIPSSRRTAAWRARFHIRTGSITGLDATPMSLDDTGWPRAMDRPAAERELVRLRRQSRSILTRPWRQLMQLQDLLSPGFLRVNISYYWSLVCQYGPYFALKSISAGIRTHFLDHDR